MRLFTLLVPACGARAASAACDGFGFARNAAATFDVFYWLQVTNFDVRLLNSAPNGPDYIDIVGLCLHAQLFRRKVRLNWSSCQALNSAREAMQSCCQSVQLPHLPVASQKNNSDANGHEQKLNVSKLLSKMSLRWWQNSKRSARILRSSTRS